MHLGKPTSYTDIRSPSLLTSIPRGEGRSGMEANALPFTGLDIWNHYEFSWLSASGKPEVRLASFSFPALSPSLIESKSMKLYLGSYAGTRFRESDEVLSFLASDLASAAGAEVGVRLVAPEAVQQKGLGSFAGDCLDAMQVSMDSFQPDPALLETGTGPRLRESLYSNLLRSLCPVTGQPDYGSVLVQYAGPPISREGLLRYLVSYRQHQAFGEHLTERIFMDILQRCAPESLLVHVCFTRRGGLDINPLRASPGHLVEEKPRLWWQ